MAGSGKYSNKYLLQKSFFQVQYRKQPTSTFAHLFAGGDVAEAILLMLFLIKSSVNKSVAIGESPQSFLCKYVEVFL